MKILALPRYGRLGASSRVRFYQYIDRFVDDGFRIETSALLDDDYLQRKYSGLGVLSLIAKGYARRMGCLIASRGEDAIWVEKELWPWMPTALEMAALAGRQLVLDFDDAIFHNYDLHSSALLRRLFDRKIDTLMCRANLVTAGNEYLALRARAAGAKRVELLPTVIDLDRYPWPAPRRPADRRTVIVWIGSPATVHYLQQLAGPLARLAAGSDIELHVIGARLELPGVRCLHIPWAEAGEVAAISAGDIGIMPLLDSPWERGKCGYKLIQYMACGLPVVASPVGVNRNIVSDGGNGFLAGDDEAWVQALTRLVADADLRKRLGEAGRRRVEDEYCLQVTGPRLSGWLRGLKN